MENLIYLINSDIFEVFATMLTTLISTYFLYKGISEIKDNYNFRKSFTIKDASKIEIPKDLYCIQYIDSDRLSKSKYKEVIYNFISKMQSVMPEDNLHILFNNINSLVIEESYKKKRKNKKEKKTKTYAYYAYQTNKITIFSKKEMYLYHELVHMATTIISNNTFFSGFRQISKEKNFDIANALNEGYTQVFVKRYFNDFYDKNCYDVETDWMEKIENLVGKEKMEELFTHTNLCGLIEELEKYETKENIMKIISEMDFYTKYVTEEKRTNIKDAFVLRKVYDVYRFLYKCELKKLKNDFEEGNIDFNKFMTRYNIIEEKYKDYIIKCKVKDECQNIIFENSKKK